jgi:hypothetical protein
MLNKQRDIENAVRAVLREGACQDFRVWAGG